MDYIIKGETLKGIADAIRFKTKKTDELMPSKFAEEIRAITAVEELPSVETWAFVLANGTTVTKEVMIK